MRSLGRRGVLLGGLAGAAVASTPAVGARGPRVVVVGAGLAGLTAAHRLRHRAGWRVVVHDARDRVGGRVHTVRGLPGGLYAEAGGSFVSSGDAAIRHLARELGVPLIDVEAIWPAGGTAYHFGGRARTRAEVFRGESATWREADRQLLRLTWPVRAGERHPDAVRLDRMTVAEWLERHVAPRAATYGDYVKEYLETDYTAPVDEASALMVIGELAAAGRSYDERFVVEGGTDTITTTLAAGLDVRPGSALVAVRRRAHGYRLTFEEDGARSDVDADAVVLALPFRALARVDLSRAGFSPLKRRAIRTLGMGVGMKVNIAYDEAAWRPESSGESVSDLTPGWTWPGHLGQRTPTRLMVCLTGASGMPDVAGAPVHGLAPRRLADAYLRDLETIFPGSRSAYAGATRVDRWVADPWARGTYSYYRAGTMTEIAGTEGRPEGAAFFAGEHTARYSNRSTMNGAVWSGDRAARQVARHLSAR